MIKRTFLQAVRLERGQVESFAKYPFSIPATRQITRDFLNRHDRMLEILLGEEEADLKSKERR